MKLLITDIANLVKLASPLILSQIVQSAIPLSNTLIVGRLGAESLAGIALASTFFILTSIAFSGILYSINPLVSNSYKSVENLEDTQNIMSQGIFLALALSVPAICLLWFSEPIFLFLKQPPNVAAIAASYLRLIALGVPASFQSVVIRGYLEGTQRARPILFVTISGFALNIFLNIILVFGLGDIPAFGLVGSGLASAITYWFMFIFISRFVNMREGKIFFRSPDILVLLSILNLGLPISLTFLSEFGFFAAIASLVGHFGTDALAAHLITLQCSTFVYNIPIGLSFAATALVSNKLSLKDCEGVIRVSWVSISLSVVVMMLWSLLLFTHPPFVIGLFLDEGNPANQNTSVLAISLLKIAAIYQIFDGLQVVCLGMLRGFQDTRFPLFITTFSYWGVGLLIGWLSAFKFNLEVKGLWFGLASGLAVGAILLLWRTYFLLRQFKNEVQYQRISA
jgi:multidrug resistance protein, MATE family